MSCQIIASCAVNERLSIIITAHEQHHGNNKWNTQPLCNFHYPLVLMYYDLANECKLISQVTFSNWSARAMLSPDGEYLFVLFEENIYRAPIMEAPFVVAGRLDGKVSSNLVETCTQIATAAGGPQFVTPGDIGHCCSWRGDRILIAVEGTLTVWDQSKGIVHEKNSLDRSESNKFLFMSPDGALIYPGNIDSRAPQELLHVDEAAVRVKLDRMVPTLEDSVEVSFAPNMSTVVTYSQGREANEGNLIVFPLPERERLRVGCTIEPSFRQPIRLTRRPVHAFNVGDYIVLIAQGSKVVRIFDMESKNVSMKFTLEYEPFHVVIGSPSPNCGVLIFYCGDSEGVTRVIVVKFRP